jgi:hypothetical protein
MPFRRLRSLASVLPVIGEKSRALVELSRIDLLDRPRDRGMDAGSSLRELRAVGNFLSEWVLERVLGFRVERLQVEELGVGERKKSGGQIAVAENSDSPQYRLGEPLADRRRRL